MKGKISKRCISLLLAVLMVLSALPIVALQVFAATNETGLFDSEIGIKFINGNGICWANGTTAFASAFSTKGKIFSAIIHIVRKQHQYKFKIIQMPPQNCSLTMRLKEAVS